MNEAGVYSVRDVAVNYVDLSRKRMRLAISTCRGKPISPRWYELPRFLKLWFENVRLLLE